MIVTLTDGRKFKFTFRHIVDRKQQLTADSDFDDNSRLCALLGDMEDKHNLPPFGLVGYTECHIAPIDAPYDHAQGIAMCSGLDAFDKERGRKLSLSRALMVVFSKDQLGWYESRSAFWHAYFSRGLPDAVQVDQPVGV